MTKDEYERRSIEYQKIIQPFVQQMTHLHIMFNVPSWTWDEGGNLIIKYHWTDPQAEDLYKRYTDIILMIRDGIFGERNYP